MTRRNLFRALVGLPLAPVAVPALPAPRTDFQRLLAPGLAKASNGRSLTASTNTTLRYRITDEMLEDDQRWYPGKVIPLSYKPLWR